MKVIYRTHAVHRMFQRSISPETVKKVLDKGEIIENYPEDLPYPSRLMLAWDGARPVHVVAAENKAEDETIVITAYEPDARQWENDFKRRKK